MKFIGSFSSLLLIQEGLLSVTSESKWTKLDRAWPGKKRGCMN